LKFYLSHIISAIKYVLTTTTLKCKDTAVGHYTINKYARKVK